MSWQMVFGECPACRKEISRLASRCPYCTTVLRTPPEKKQPPTKEEIEQARAYLREHNPDSLLASEPSYLKMFPYIAGPFCGFLLYVGDGPMFLNIVYIVVIIISVLMVFSSPSKKTPVNMEPPMVEPATVKTKKLSNKTTDTNRRVSSSKSRLPKVSDAPTKSTAKKPKVNAAPTKSSAKSVKTTVRTRKKSAD